jgi:hypothetical protein
LKQSLLQRVGTWCPMGLFALTCPCELSNQAVLTWSALLFGYPAPHARYLKASEALYHKINLWGDALLNDPSHAAGCPNSVLSFITQSSCSTLQQLVALVLLL